MVRLSLTLANPDSKSEPKSNPDANNTTKPDLYPQLSYDPSLTLNIILNV